MSNDVFNILKLQKILIDSSWSKKQAKQKVSVKKKIPRLENSVLRLKMA